MCLYILLLNICNQTHSQNQILVDDFERNDGCSKHKKIAVISILVITVIAIVIAGVVFVSYGKYDLPFQLPNSSMDFMCNRSTPPQLYIHYCC